MDREPAGRTDIVRSNQKVIVELIGIQKGGSGTNILQTSGVTNTSTNS